MHIQYWPSSGSESYGHFNVKWVSTDDGRMFSVHKMQLIKVHNQNIEYNTSSTSLCSLQHNLARDIALFHYHAWTNDAAPSDISGLMDMMAQLEQWQKRTQENRMIVHCW